MCDGDCTLKIDKIVIKNVHRNGHKLIDKKTCLYKYTVY